MALTLRNTKGTPLTYTEMDDNLEYLETLATTPAPTGVTTTYVPFQGATGWVTGKIYYKGGDPTKLYIDNLPKFVSDAAAGTGGLTAGGMYQTQGGGQGIFGTPGIVMIKQ
jgi:hypothetical protein